jgi:hypothetical protein
MRTCWSIPCSWRVLCPYDATARMIGDAERVPLAILEAMVRSDLFSYVEWELMATFGGP